MADHRLTGPDRFGQKFVACAMGLVKVRPSPYSKFTTMIKIEYIEVQKEGNASQGSWEPIHHKHRAPAVCGLVYPARLRITATSQSSSTIPAPAAFPRCSYSLGSPRGPGRPTHIVSSRPCRLAPPLPRWPKCGISSLALGKYASGGVLWWEEGRRRLLTVCLLQRFAPFRSDETSQKILELTKFLRKRWEKSRLTNFLILKRTDEVARVV
jgi:hypothetical protein